MTRLKLALVMLAPFMLALALPVSAQARTQGWISETPQANGAVLVDKSAADIVRAEDDAAVVDIAAHDLAADIARVTGQTPAVLATSTARQQVWIGTIGHNAQIDALAASGRIDLSALKNCWECYVVTTVKTPAPGIDAALVIAGSDRRGTAYGAYEVSQGIGVSPWVWWSDVVPVKKKALYVAPGLHRFGPPSVKYRGIFINDEDLGLKVWAAKTFDPQLGNIGPKTYEKVFSLLLRLKANSLWPAMHPGTRPFNAKDGNSDGEDAILADRYAIVMGSSHAEPMLRNNVGEWTAKPDDFNYATNSAGVQAYWRERLKTNGKFENLYTLGMRGIHDSGIVGASTLEGRQALLNTVLKDQRRMLQDEVGDPQKLAQIFVPYKEVLDIYQAGLDLPDDVTLVWPDDNFGYIRHFPDASERKRSGGSGVYYHLSYLGRPLSYIWLSSTPPALIQEEMLRVYDNGADRVWIANVGDIKPAEVSLSYFLDLAWDVPGTRKLSQRQWLDGFAAKTFGEGVATQIGGIWDDYYRLNFVRKPEHLQWNLIKEAPKASPLSAKDIYQRIDAFNALGRKADKTATRVPPSQRDAYFELVGYPVKASALANRRYFAFECAVVADKGCAFKDSPAALDAQLKSLTDQFGTLGNGKWAGILAHDTVYNTFWKSYTALARDWTKVGPGDLAASPVDTAEPLRLSGWRAVTGLGYQASDASVPLVATGTAKAGQAVRISILPSFPTDNADAWRLEVQVNDGPRQPLSFSRGPTDYDPNWGRGVLDNRLSVIVPVAAGPVKIRIFTAQSGLIVRQVDRVQVDGVQALPAK